MVRAEQCTQAPFRTFTEGKLSATRFINLLLITGDDESAHLIRTGVVLLFWVNDEDRAVVFRPFLGCPEAQFDALSRAFRLDHDVATTVRCVPSGGASVHLDQCPPEVEHL